MFVCGRMHVQRKFMLLIAISTQHDGRRYGGLLSVQIWMYMYIVDTNLPLKCVWTGFWFMLLHFIEFI